MKQLDQLKKQHEEIIQIINESKLLLNNMSDENKTVLAKNISRLAGILKIHLGNEDRYLYPSFMKSTNNSIKKKATSYQEEMGDLSMVFTEFKTQYNTKSRIDAKGSEAVKEITAVFSAVEKRITKEDRELYVLAEKL